MMIFVIAHPWLSLLGAAYLTVAILSWALIAGAAIASRD